jgi:hypothetical protein
LSAHGSPAPPLQLLEGRPFRVADVAMFYGERSGGIRTYLSEKVAYAARNGAFEHHVVVPGRIERHEDGWHELRALRVAASNGYRIPLGVGAPCAPPRPGRGGGARGQLQLGVRLRGGACGPRAAVRRLVSAFSGGGSRRTASS